ncbi:MAG TPA: ABC transporter ATP-binding protein [Caldithrix sp.]|nr:ABC transporter ATP-binding protein [Calditrichaceae bacterium]HEM48983.1 ABC transporter ATP-binding protein [Caldithrix sp.]
MALIEIQHLDKIYNSSAVAVHALNDVTLNVEKKEFTAIVGPSGSGKTTMLNILGGLDKPSSGFIKIEGTDIFKLKSSELIDYRLNHIGFVFQAYNLIPVFTARENVEFIMLLQGVSKKEREKQAMALLDSVGLADRSNSRPNQLSGGQQQRVAVARSLASHPDFVLADEPTANLDSESAGDLLDLMETLNESHNMTFIFSTHDDRVIKRARRIITLQDGAVKSDVMN